MRKSKFLIGVLILALMLMGAGYAVWTDTVVVTAEVNSGEFDVDLTCILHDVLDVDPRCDSGCCIVEKLDDFTNVESFIDGDTAKVTIYDIYPGASVLLYLSFENFGTVPAVCDGFNADHFVNYDDPDNLLSNWIDVEYSIDNVNFFGTYEAFKNYYSQNGLDCCILYPEYWTEGGYFDPDEVVTGCSNYCTGPCTCYQYECESETYRNCAGIFVRFTMDIDAPNPLMNDQVDYTLEFDFIQWNE